MATSSDTSVSFEEADARSEEMHSTIETWIDDLVNDSPHIRPKVLT